MIRSYLITNMGFCQFLRIQKNTAIILLFSIGVLLVLFLSWKVNPNLEELPLIPNWLSNWTDDVQNSRRRTALPLIGLGFLLGSYLVYIKRTILASWFFGWLILLGIVALAEGGQYFLPSRSPDIKDLVWGGIGAAIGLFFSFFVWQLIGMDKRRHCENKKV